MAGQPVRRVVVRRFLVAVAALATLVVALPSTVAGAAITPTVVSFTASPTSLPNTGGTTTLSAVVTDAVSCKFTGSTSLGLPVTVPCDSGTGSVDVAIPANSATSAKTWSFKVIAIRPGSSTTSAPVTVTVDPTPAPAIGSFTATPNALPNTGGSTTLAVNVTNAVTCKFSGPTTVVGLPASADCSGGSASVPITIPANSTTSPKTYTLKVTASRPGVTAVSTTTTVVVAPTPPPGVVSLTASPTALLPSGGSVELSASVTDAATCKFSSTSTLAGLPVTVPCAGGSATTTVTLPANATTKTKTYSFKVTAARPGSSTTSAPVAVQVVSANALADLSLTTNPVAPGFVGDDVTTTFTVSNAGPAGATGVVVSATLPPDATFVSGTPSQGEPCTESAGDITCAVGPLGSGANATVAITFVPTALGTVTINGAVTADQLDADTANNTATQSVSVTTPKVVYTDDQTGQLYALSYPSGSSTAITTQAGSKDVPVLSPDRTRVAYSRQNPVTFRQELWVVGIDGSDEHLVADPGLSNAWRPSWSPDSTTLAFTAIVSGQYKAMIANATGAPNAHLLITDMAYGEMWPAYSPDGTKIIFREQGLQPPPAGSRYHIVNADGSGTPSAFTSYPVGQGVVWSPDGQWFYFAATSGSTSIYRARVDGTLSEPIATNLGGGISYWSLSPSGTKVAYTELVGGKNVISVVDVDGTNHAQLTTAYAAADPAGCYSPTWNSDSDEVLMHCYPGSGAISIYRVSLGLGAPTAPTFLGGGFRSRNPDFFGSRPTG